MLRISEVWRIRQIKFQKQSKKCKHFTPFFEILLGSEQLQIIDIKQFWGRTIRNSRVGSINRMWLNEKTEIYIWQA